MTALQLIEEVFKQREHGIISHDTAFTAIAVVHKLGLISYEKQLQLITELHNLKGANVETRKGVTYLDNVAI